jgi:hypothetical protein
VAVDDPPDDGQADASARELGGGVEPLERGEQLVSVDRVKADPVVAHIAADGGIADGRGRELDGGVLAACGELPGIFKQVLQHGPDQGAVRGDPDAVFDGHPDPAAGVTDLELIADGGDLGAEINVSETYLGAGHKCQLQHVIEHVGHVPAGSLDAAGVPASRFVEPVAVLLGQGFGEPAYPP